MKKRVLSMFMALVLCLTLLPAPVRAEETVCICTDRCSDEMVNLDCPICSAENADLSACLGKEAELPLMAAAASTEETISGNVTWENRNITTPVVVKGDTTITLKGENSIYQPATETTDKYDIDDDGTKDTVYEISNAGQLYWFAGLVNGTLDGVEQNTLANAILTANITVNENLLASLQYDTEGNVSNGSDFITWTPIADCMEDHITLYSGTFDGNNKTVSGLYFNGNSTRIGLFGSSESDGNIKNVGVVDSYFKGNDFVGGVCGRNSGTITNCYNAGNLTAIESSATIGGICGYNDGTVTNCYNTGTVTATDQVASVCGVCGCSTAPISNCYNIGTVTATSSSTDISGICGYNFGPVTNCYYLADTEDENGGKTAAQFASGEIAYLLSQGFSTGEGDDTVTYDGSIWGQALEGDNSDKYPKLYTDGSNKVYHIVTKYKTCDHDPNPSSYTDESRILGETYANNQTTPAFENKGFTWTLNEDKTQHVCSVCGQKYDHANVYSADADNHKITAKCYYDESENRGSLTISTPTVSGGLTEIFYDGSPKEAVVTNDFSEVKPEIEVTYTYQAADSNETKTLTKDEKPTAAGNYTASVSLTGADKKTATVSVSYEIKKATPTLTWADNATEKTITYTGQEITANDLPAVTVGLQNGKTFSGTINYSYVKKTDGTSDSIPTSGLPTDVGIYEVTAFIPDSDNYIGSTSNVLTLTITKASNDFTTALSCSDHTYAKDETPKPNATAKFGTVTYKYAEADSDGNAPAADSAYTDAIPVNVGTYAVKAYVAETDNYAGLASDPVVFAINKAASPTIAGEEKSYIYSTGSDGKTIGVDIAGKLPTDRGTTTYAVAKTDTEQLLSEVTVDTAGNLTYKVNQVDASKVGKTAIITVTASMENYANAGYTLTISITDKKTVEIKSGNTVSVDGSNALTYGEKVSKLTLGNTVFVEAGTDNMVEGILSWSNPDEIPAAGTTQAGWVFKPDDSKYYEDLTGTAAITVARATPAVVTVPTVAERVYNPAVALADSDMTGGSVTRADGNSLAGTWSFTGTNIVPTVNNKGYQAVFTPDDADNYNTVTRTITVKVIKATLVIAEKPTAGALTYGQKLSDSTLTGGKAAYQTADGTEITGTFAWKNGSIKPTAADSEKTEYDVTFTPSDKDNYNTVDAKLALAVNKAALAALSGESRSYIYAEGSNDKAETMDVAGKLPADRGNTTFTLAAEDADGLLSDVKVDTAGKLSYKVKQLTADKAGKSAAITVTASMENYEDAVYTMTIRITDKKLVTLKSGNTVSVNGSNALTYGDKLSKLSFSSVTFVEADTDTEVKGVLEWADPDCIPTAGTTQAGWVFKPADSKHYEELTGTAAITVARATPAVVTVPAVAERVYNPAVALADSDMTGGSVTGADGNELAGTWSFTGTIIIPTVNNKGYQAVFTPDDTNNYSTVTRTITVKVTKATPVIAEKPTAGALTYGQELSDSTLTGGKAAYQTADGTEITGTFAWKNSSSTPTAADSKKTEYDVTFTPSDKDNYNAVDTKLTITVNKAAQAPNMPEAAMTPAHSTKKVGNITLPEGWSWQEADKDTALEDGVAVTATAVYTGADKGNYETESVSITITRSKCDHTHTEIRNQREATCTQTGYAGDTYCTDCDKLLSTGKELAALGHDYKATVTKQPTTTEEGVRTYTCTRCSSSYTESIAKLPEEQHTHNYTGSITKEATCTEPGARTYTCSCGDSYTENIPATGHSYVSKVTKAATTTEEGIMTYTCSKCGHSYTQPIAKIKSDDSSKDNGSQNQKPQPGTDNGNQNQEPQPDTDNGKDNGTSIKPYIKDDSGKKGWDVIKPQLEEAKSGDTVTVAMNGTTVVPKDVIDSIKGKDTTLVLDMGNGLSWKIFGKDITDAAGDIDFGVTVGADAGKSIPVDVINNVTGERYSINLTLAYDGELGFTATLTVNMESKNAGLYANLFYYNEQTGELEFICAGQIDSDGNVELVFTHASDYTIVVDTRVMSDNGQADNKADETIPAPKTDYSTSKYAWNNTIIIIIGICIILIVFGAVFYVRKKSGSEEE